MSEPFNVENVVEELLQESEDKAYRSGYLAGLEKAKDLYHERIPQQQHLSIFGDPCSCFLCAVDKLLKESTNT